MNANPLDVKVKAQNANKGMTKKEIAQKAAKEEIAKKKAEEKPAEITKAE